MSKIHTRPLVLIVEDYDDTREMYRDYLEFCGFAVATASNGVEAIEKATAMHPDVILMDLSLPVMDGWEATRRLKASPETAGLKIIALSAYPPTSDGSPVRASGCDGFIAKPCLPTDLVEQLSVILSLNRSGSSSARRTVGPRD